MKNETRKIKTAPRDEAVRAGERVEAIEGICTYIYQDIIILLFIYSDIDIFIKIYKRGGFGSSVGAIFGTAPSQADQIRGTSCQEEQGGKVSNSR